MSNHFVNLSTLIYFEQWKVVKYHFNQNMRIKNRKQKKSKINETKTNKTTVGINTLVFAM